MPEVRVLVCDFRSGSRLGSVGGFTLGPLQPNKQTFIDANVTTTTCFNDRPASRPVERALRAEAFLLHLVPPVVPEPTVRMLGIGY